MPANSFEDALGKIALALTSEPDQPASRIDEDGKAKRPLPDPDEPWRETIAKQVYYSQQVPLIDRQLLEQIEDIVPHVVKHLKSLTTHQTTRAEFATAFGNAMNIYASRRSEQDHQRLNALSQIMVDDAFEKSKERKAPLAPIAVASLAVGSVALGFAIGTYILK
jgi:hypothetical protein